MLNDLQKEVFKELINVAFGKATASLADLLDSFATLKVPKIEIFDASYLTEYLNKVSNNKMIYQAQQSFSGQLNGETLFIINEESLERLTKHLFNEVEITQNHKDDAIIEITNILSVVTIGKLAELTSLRTNFLAPMTNVSKNTNYKNITDGNDYNSLITVHTVIEFSNEKIEGNLIIMSADTMMNNLIEAIDNIIEKEL